VNKKYKGTPITKTISYYENDDAKKGSYKNIYNDDSYHPLNLRIVGVLRPSKESYISLMPSSIGYLSSLKDDLVSNSQSGQKGENLAQIASQNYYINRGTDSRYENSSDGLDTLNAAVKTVLDSMSDPSQTALSESTFENLFSSAYTFRSPFSNGNESYPGFLGSFSGFLTWNRKVGGDFKENNVVLPATPKDTSSQTWTDFVTFWTKRLVNPAFYNGTEPDWSAIDFEAYFNGYALVSSVLIFPKSLTTKDALHDYLDAYNNGKADVDQIQWSDIMETFTSSLSVLIQIISVVLIVFAAISLVVSSVMTGIITYVSVVERTKEIGILRACGARKKDVGRLFEAECTIIGFAAGVIGMGFTYLACIPINLILDHLYPDNNLSTIASLNPWHALILLILAIVLALISGLIPSRMAAKKDPVVALRTE
jgi:ABC-type antimicrobial peptide transport system permease subunit